MKTPEELNTLKEEVEALNKKLHELTGEELKQVVGGANGAGEFRYNMATISSACIACGMCKEHCPMNAICEDDLHYYVNTDWCLGCAACVDYCPVNAISIVEMS